MSNKINKVARHLLEMFEVKTKTSGEEIIICHCKSHLQNFIKTVHGELLPDNFIYQIIYKCIESVANESRDLCAVLEEIPANTNIYDLTEWSISNRLRIYSVNDTLSEYQGDNYTALLHLAQASEIEGICVETISYLEKLSN